MWSIKQSIDGLRENLSLPPEKGKLCGAAAGTR
jgi:hypothetical protein